MANQPAGFQFAKPYDPTNPVSSDMRYGKYNGTTTIPFVSTTEALDLIKPALRYQGLQCVIVNGSSISLYWFRNGIADTDLVLLQTDVNISGKEDTTNKKDVVRQIGGPDGASTQYYVSEYGVRNALNSLPIASASQNGLLSTTDFTKIQSNAATLATKGMANGLATLDNSGLIPASQLPSYVDDVLEFGTFALLPSIGEAGKIYITINDNNQYRWSGSVYVQITASPGSTDAVPEGSANKYFTETRVRSTLLTSVNANLTGTPSSTDTLSQFIGRVINFISSYTAKVRATIIIGFVKTNSTVTTADTIEGALGKLQGQIEAFGITGEKINIGNNSSLSGSGHIVALLDANGKFIRDVNLG